MTLVLNATNHNWKMGKRLGNQAYRKMANERLETVEYKTTRLLEGFLRIHLKGLNTFGISTFPGIESRWGRDFPQPFRPTLGSTELPIQWVPRRSPVKPSGRVVDHLHPPSAEVKERVLPSGPS